MLLKNIKTQKHRDNSNAETITFKVAWAAVEKVYHKDNNGKWQPK